MEETRPTDRSSWRQDRFGKQAQRDPWASHFERMCTYPIWMDFDSSRVDLMDAQEDQLLLKHAQAGLLGARTLYLDEPFPDYPEFQVLSASAKADAAAGEHWRRREEAKKARLEKRRREEPTVIAFLEEISDEGLAKHFADWCHDNGPRHGLAVFGSASATYQAIRNFRVGKHQDSSGKIATLVDWARKIYVKPWEDPAVIDSLSPPSRTALIEEWPFPGVAWGN